jgi:hypothetical protein
MRTRARFHQSTAIPSKTSDLVPSLPPSPLNTDVSNRNWKLLEIVVIPTRHSPDLISNRNKNTLFRTAWGSQFWLRNHNPSTVNCARTPAARLRNPYFSVRRAPSAFSNRHWMRLEIAVTPTKHSPKLFLIDNENRILAPRRAARPLSIFPIASAKMGVSISLKDRS